MTKNNYDSQRQAQYIDGYRDVAMVVILSVITCGIYSLYWVYKISEKMNRELRTGKSEVAQLLLYMFVPFYSWYWYFKETENLCIYGKGRGKHPDEGMTVVNLILCVVGLAIVAIALMQDMLNKIVDDNRDDYSREYQNMYAGGNGSYGDYTYSQPQPETRTAPQPEQKYEPPIQETVAEGDDSAQDIIENLQTELQTDPDTYDDPIEQYMHDGKSAKGDTAAEAVDAQAVESIPYSELKKLKELLDEEIITQSEFEQLKQKFMK